MKKYVAYYRVSTQKQGQSGLGLEAQKKTVEKFCEGGQILAEYTDIESGKNNNRPELLKAIAHAKNNDALLVIAKLDRLSRNVYFISSLLESRVHFKACDLPEADHFTVHLFAALAEKERKMISERTKAALQAKKTQGHKLGNLKNLTREGAQQGAKAYQKAAVENMNNRRATALIVFLRNSGMKWLHIADQLNQTGFTTSRGKLFKAEQVKRLYVRSLAAGIQPVPAS
ncbi:recombinase family protein [Cytophagaceae bacterium DM2B3-1]|uniref:Recombinase family protein n=1 Tax=Xanthocytophaga flava TaxID=3048013 RepID=A0ABT7CYP9_9BACT|nr:recombinase family protein [Xanthocytophaga flavus]MDJ1498791.1 recombinase family protein [Xanthocytophaga flavus]